MIKKWKRLKGTEKFGMIFMLVFASIIGLIIASAIINEKPLEKSSGPLDLKDYRHDKRAKRW